MTRRKAASLGHPLESSVDPAVREAAQSPPSTRDTDATPTSPRLLTSAEAADFLTLKESTLRDYSRRGIVPSVKIGRHLRFIEADLVAYLDGLRRSVEAPMQGGFGRRSW
jgi:excisionase family DNA binding protein